MMKNSKRRLQKSPLLNLSMPRCILRATGDVLSTLIFELIHYRFIKNDKKPVWLKLDWIHERLPYMSRSGLAKKLKKLVKDGHIIEKKGEGRHYHKCWYRPDPDALRRVMGGDDAKAKVYYNQDMAEENLEASVIYAAIISLLKIQDDSPMPRRGTKLKIGVFNGRVDDAVLLDYGKLVDGSGLTLNRVRKAVAWLIKHKKLESKKLFGNKRLVSLPADTIIKPSDWESYFADQPPTESFLHWPPDDPTEYPHES